MIDLLERARAIFIRGFPEEVCLVICCPFSGYGVSAGPHQAALVAARWPADDRRSLGGVPNPSRTPAGSA